MLRNNNNNNINNNDVFIYHSILKNVRMVSERLSIIINITTTTIKTTEKQRKIVNPRLAVDLNALIQHKDYN